MFTNKTPWILLLFLWMGGSTWWHVCRIKQLCVNDGETPAVTSPATDTATVAAPLAPAMPTLTISDGDRLNLSVPGGNVSYAKSGAVANTAAVGNAVVELATYLKANPRRRLTISGHYRADERNATTYPSLGVARAENMKKQLTKLGVPAGQVTTKGVRIGATGEQDMVYNARGDSLYGGLAFAFTGATPPAADTTAAPAPRTDLPKTEEGLAEAQKFTSVFKPIDLYFKLGQSGYIQTADTRRFFAEAETYLKANKGKKLMVTGHTDDRGPDQVNLELSKSRANTVKSRLRNAGISSDQIVVEAKGETQPKESNTTFEGRKANRRVTVVVQ